MDIVKRIDEINLSQSENEIFLKNGIISLAFYEPDQFSNLVAEINIEKEKFISTQDRKIFIEKYKQVYKAQRKKLKHILKNIENRTINIYPEPSREDMILFLKNTWNYNDNISNKENLYQYAETRIKYAIFNTAEELYILQNHPSVYYNKRVSYIGGSFGYRFKQEIIIYNKINAMSDGSHHFLIYANDESSLSDKRALLNILAYLNGAPNFEFLNNRRVNQKLDELYSNFDLLDCVRLRHQNYLKSDVDKAIHLELPVIKRCKDYNFIAFKEMPHEGILDLYHASLKQFEPLPRCIFLYRVFEYASANHYKTTFSPVEYSPEMALNYYINEALSYKPNPLYFIDFEVGNENVKLHNLFTILRLEAKKIIQEWSVAPFLSSKSIGEIIYLTGRNFTAHGASGRHGERNMQYDYDKNYIHINNVNILLELIARYVIELLNPELKNIVERKKFHYTQRYKSILDKKNEIIK